MIGSRLSQDSALLLLLPHVTERVLRLATIALAVHRHGLSLFTGLLHGPGGTALDDGLLILRLGRLLSRRVIVVAYQLDSS